MLLTKRTAVVIKGSLHCLDRQFINAVMNTVITYFHKFSRSVKYYLLCLFYEFSNIPYILCNKFNLI